MKFLKQKKGKADMKGEMKMMTQVQYCADNFDREHAMCMSEMGYWALMFVIVPEFKDWLAQFLIYFAFLLHEYLSKQS